MKSKLNSNINFSNCMYFIRKYYRYLIFILHPHNLCCMVSSLCAACRPTSTASCYQTLSTVEIYECDKLKDMSWLILAPNLRNLKIYLYDKMEGILNEGKLGEVAGVIGIPYAKSFFKLETLYLFWLPKLKSIYWDVLLFPCLKRIRINACRELKKLTLNSDSAKGNQLSIEGSKDWWATLEWENEATRDAFLPSFKSVPT
ncbi:hypothetical protein J1N35_033222 [Gossypium stocksii]|uniref:Disease resistance protein At4g27190-like leucine-rich repeats domain-containing protein n=1 Tax=Gossypium stocksii TaxID=47602 RepID=A0A9D3UPR6_9ROSI|nr:hypothetical protein J1N35_033222 [Gossypium stocksii]